MIVSADASRRVDPVVANILKEVETKLPLIPITRLENYEFNESLLKLDKYVLVDFVEVGWEWNMEETQLFGKNTKLFNHLFVGDEWKKFDDFVTGKPPLLYLKRELLNKDVSQAVKPMQYPALNKIPPIQSKNEFEKRQIAVNFIWGLSHEERKRVHADIWKQSGKHGYVVCDNINILEPFLAYEDNPNKWLTVNTPHYARYPIEVILGINGFSKISMSLAGAGRVCFRHTESPINSVMYMWEDEIAWSHPWMNNVNCIKSEEGKEVETIVEALNNPLLYAVYIAGVENCKNYYIDNYVSNYLEPMINSL
jgi:hypothetical protein